jgi:glycosyltransferase involved in cell wall biosynthesis
VELDVVEGVPHHQARERYARADIVVDQLNAGWHGVFALEAMALGKPVVGHLAPDVVERSAEAFGMRVPIVPAGAETLTDALRPLVADAALRRELGAQGRDYVERVHDGDRVADRLLAVYAQL